MLRRIVSISLISALTAAILVAPAQAQSAPSEQAGVVRAGYGEADATWNVGAGAGQHADKSPDQANLVAGGEVDPHSNSVTQKDSYGVQSRLSYRAIVVEDAEGDQTVFVKSDNYLAQDYLARRAGQILAAEGSSISYDEIFHMASHNHSSPYYTSPSWGVFVFQDVFDMRAFEYHARQMAAAIMEAEKGMVPARMGATTVTHRLFKGMVQKKNIADDGTPRGYPDDFGDMGLSILRFDSLEDPSDPQPLATMINWGQHPEGLSGHDLITGDYIAPLERLVERATGAPLVFGQGDVGSAEGGPGRPELVPDGIPKQWYYAGFAQGERGAFLLAEDVIEGWEAIGAGDATVPFESDFDVEAGNAFIPGPVSHPYPSVSNCRTETTVEGSPGAPVAGFPDCERGGQKPDRNNMLWESLKQQGIPVPDNYDAPSFTGVQENMRLHLQAFKVGEVLLASCACEAQVDLILNLESRADEQQNNLWDGYDWTEKLGCTQASEGGDWTCRNVQPGQPDITFSDARYRRMKAQIHNDAAGWDAPENAVAANSEPTDPAKIWGNFTKEELPEDLGYKLPIGVGHATDYNGYTVSYREYMSHDEYRKALTPYGPHTADYMVTRLVRLAGELNGGPALEPEPLDLLAQVDEARQVALSTALGATTSAAYDAWRATLPNDVGPAVALTEPESIQRFDGTEFSWRGGSNAVDNPTVRVERLVDGEWTSFADQTGEVQTRLDFPKGANGVFDTYTGAEEWVWTANFEAFDAFPRQIGSTPTGTYRFVVDGAIRQNNADTPYHLASQPFEVTPWDGIKVTDARSEAGRVSFAVADPTYPMTYASSFDYIGVEMMKDKVGQPFCTSCSFRPWATGATIAEVRVTIERKNGTMEQVDATQGADGRWSAPTTLYVGDRAYVAPGDAIDSYGEINGERSAVVDGTVRRGSTLDLTMTGRGNQKNLNVTLLGDDGPLAGRTVQLFADGVGFASVTTGADGTVSLTLRPRYRGAEVYEARFEGDAEYLPSGDSVVVSG